MPTYIRHPPSNTQRRPLKKNRSPPQNREQYSPATEFTKDGKPQAFPWPSVISATSELEEPFRSATTASSPSATPAVSRGELIPDTLLIQNQFLGMSTSNPKSRERNQPVRRLLGEVEDAADLEGADGEERRLHQWLLPPRFEPKCYEVISSKFQIPTGLLFLLLLWATLRVQVFTAPVLLHTARFTILHRLQTQE